MAQLLRWMERLSEGLSRRSSARSLNGEMGRAGGNSTSLWVGERDGEGPCLWEALPTRAQTRLAGALMKTPPHASHTSPTSP